MKSFSVMKGSSSLDYRNATYGNPMKRRRALLGLGRLGAGVLVGVMVLVGANALRVGTARANDGNGFCQKTVIHNFGQPIAKLPTIHGLPSSGRLPFGPRSLEVRPIGLTGIIVGGGQAGVVFSVPGPVRLDWDLDATLVRIDKDGGERGRVNRRSLRIRRIGDQTRTMPVGFAVSSRPAFYRFDVTIRADSGKWLGHYAEYFRVVAREVKVDIALSAEVYPPGGTLLARLRNLGSAEVFYGYELLIERWSGAEWVTDPSTPSGWPLIGLGLSGGAVGGCEKVALGSSPGEYRITKVYATSMTGPETAVRARFRIE